VSDDEKRNGHSSLAAAGGDLMSIVEAYESEIERLLAELSAVEATRTQLVAVLSQLVTYVSLCGGYMSHGEQTLLAEARHLLGEILR
jgi:hypothetical protein